MKKHADRQMKQHERRQKTIQLLLDSTVQLIHEKGCNSITMKDIMERSGLSKGAIFHYVQTKDEIFSWILRNRLKKTNERFEEEVKHGEASFDGPMQPITDRLLELESKQDVTNKVLIYLLGKESDPVIAQTLQQFYEWSVQMSKQWIVTGQKHGVISDTVDADQVADMFMLLSLGLRVRSTLPSATITFTAQHLSDFMTRILKK